MIARGGYAGPLLVAVGGLLLVGCSTFEGDDAAASVDGTEIGRDQLEDVLRLLAENGELTGIVEDLDTASVPSQDARQVLNLLITGAASERFLAGAGEAVTDADREQALAAVPADSLVRQLPDVLDLLVYQQAAGAARSRIAAPDAAELQRRYEEFPAGAGVMCVRHIIVATEGEAKDVLGELDTGADFAELAAERSIEEVAAETGGALSGQDGQPCQLLPVAQQSFDPAFVAGAVRAQVGVPTEPVQSSFGWHVILARPYDEVAESLSALADAVPGDLLYAGYLASADITVDPRYGRWDAALGSVAPLS